MVNGDIDDPFEEELPSQPFEQPFLSMEVDNPESSTSPNDLFSSLVSISTNGNSNTGGQGKDLYKCHRCGKHFGRLDHVKRHCRSHVNDRTYSCKLCSKSFNRKDLLDRHEVIHSSISHDAGNHSKRRNRAAKACAPCVLSKAKCSDDRPCRRCQDRGQLCGPEPEVLTCLPLGSSTQSEGGIRALSPGLRSQGIWTRENRESGPTAFVGSQNQEQLSERDERRALNSLDLSLAGTQSDAEGHQSLNGADVSSIWDNNILLNDSTLDIDDDILMAMDIDWNSLIQLDYDWNYEGPVGSTPRHPGRSEDLTPRSRSRGLLVREFFKRSLWLWEPDARESASMEESPHLSEAEERFLLSSGQNKRTSEDRADAPSVLAGFACGSEARDALLLLVQRNSDSTAPVRSFPSARVLSVFLGAFAVQETLSRCPFLHLPSIKADKCRVELLGALIAAGSANFANRQIWKLGLALQEPNRLALYKAFDHNNSIARDLDPLQAQILWIEAGLWSGVRPKMEIAESVANSVPFIIRRAAAYHLGHHEHTWAPTSQDDSETLRSKWARWIEFESFKRCVFRAFINDIQGSVAYLRSPRFYTTEITVGLPAAHDIWAAPDPLTWRAAYLAKRTAAELPRPTLLDIIQDPSILPSLPREYDCELSAFAALHSLWPQIVALQDAKTLLRGSLYSKKPPQTNFWLEAQRQDLYKRLSDLRDTSNAMGILTAEARMVCELFMMALFVSFVDIEKLVGRFGVEESRLTTPRMQIWSEGDESRYAMWHAGQVLRAAQAVKPTQLRSFYANTVYQACVVLALPFLLEATSLASKGKTPGVPNNIPSTFLQARDMIDVEGQVDLVILNGPENMPVKAFLLTGKGNLALAFSDEVKALSDVDVIPSMMAKTFENNYATTTDHLPPLLEKLVALVKELTKYTRR